MTTPTRTDVTRVRGIEHHGRHWWDVVLYSHDAMLWVTDRTALDILAVSLTRGLEVTVEIDTATSEIRSVHAAAGVSS